MTITYDNNLNVARMSYHDESAGTDALRTAPYATADFFDDNATVEDAIYFHIYSPCVPYHNLYLNVGTQLVADSITVVWEYPKEGVWTAIPSVTDNTNGFQNAGANSVLFAVPEDMSHSSSSFYASNFPTTEDDLMIRCRITAVTNISEGGANQTTTPYVSDHTITATSEASLTMTDIYDADVAGSWGVVTKAGVNQYFVNCSLKLNASDLTSVKEQVELGSDKYRCGIITNSTSSVTFGAKNSEGYGYNGCGVKYWTKYSRGTSLYNLSLYGSVFWKDLGAWTSPILYDIVDIRDSTLGGDYYYFSSGIDAPSYFQRSVYACSYFFYCFTGNVAIDKLYLPYATVSCDGMLLGVGSARVDNTELVSTSQNIRRYYGCNVTLVNCSFASTDWSTESGVFVLNNSSNAGTDWYVKVYYTFDLTVVDEQGNAIEDASVYLTDGQGNAVIKPTLSGLEFSDTIYNALSTPLMDWAEPPNYSASMVGGIVIMTSGTYIGQQAIVESGATSSWSGADYSYFSIDTAISETNATFDFMKWESGKTDSDGQVAQVECLVWHAWIDESDSWSRQNVDHKDYVLKIQKNGYEPYEHRWDLKVSKEMNLRVTLKKLRCNSQHKSITN